MAAYEEAYNRVMKTAGVISGLKKTWKGLKGKAKGAKRNFELRSGAHPTKDEWMNMSDAMKEVNKTNRISKTR